MPLLSGNKGEWAEIYTFFRLLSEGKLYAADENMNKLDDTFFPVLSIIRNEVIGKLEYETGDIIKIFLNDKCVSEIEVSKFVEQADYIFDKIKKSKGRSFSSEKTEDFMHKIYISKIKAASNQKSDIIIRIQDINTGYTTESGFSIKSDFTSKSTLVNSSKATNFVFEIIGFDNEKAKYTNSIESKERIKGRMKYITSNSKSVKFDSLLNKTCENNLILVDSLFPQILAWALFYFYTENVSHIKDIVALLEERNPINYPESGMYIYKFKKFLTSCALGMTFAKKWDGIDDANGGYIVVKNNGDIVAYHIYNRNAFEKFLLENTKFERGSTGRHEYCSVYKANNKFFVNLNLAVRFL